MNALLFVYSKQIIMNALFTPNSKLFIFFSCFFTTERCDGWTEKYGSFYYIYYNYYYYSCTWYTSTDKWCERRNGLNIIIFGSNWFVLTVFELFMSFLTFVIIHDCESCILGWRPVLSCYSLGCQITHDERRPECESWIFRMWWSYGSSTSSRVSLYLHI